MPKRVGEKVILKLRAQAELTQPCMTKSRKRAVGKGWEMEEGEQGNTAWEEKFPFWQGCCREVLLQLMR